ncbi:methyltransferase domain-containing protein [Maribacter halichondriae]|uniref:methyltransferase domain-containing protein n=1 Tax=Maribacter halichondriae TaxID=2980554 RepID=UPI00235907D2|nr:methyltransferase domain-containing protein [Maribacter sp. Hal144]
MIDFSRRSAQLEIMDNMQEGFENLPMVFDDINRVNRMLGGNAITVQAVAKLFHENPKEAYVIVDMGCGDGAMLRELADYCRKQKLNVRFIGIDLNKEALQIAGRESLDYPEISYVVEDIVALDPSNFECDIVLTTLTMHHFTNAQLLIFLQKFIELTSIGVVINDLQRSRWAYYLFRGFSRIFIKTKVAKIDGLISIRKGFIKSELKEYSQRLPSVSHDIRWKWAYRYVWVMRHNPLS